MYIFRSTFSHFQQGFWNLSRIDFAQTQSNRYDTPEAAAVHAAIFLTSVAVLQYNESTTCHWHNAASKLASCLCSQRTVKIYIAMAPHTTSST